MTVTKQGEPPDLQLHSRSPLSHNALAGNPSTPVAVDFVVQECLSRLQHDTFLSYALEGSVVSIWVADNRGMRFHVGNASAGEVITAARQLRNLCRNPESDLKALHVLSQRLYQTLLQPVASLLEKDREIHVHFAANFPFLPFALLRDANGVLFGDTYLFRYAKDLPWHSRERASSKFDAHGKFLFVDAISSHTCADYLSQSSAMFPSADILCGASATWAEVGRLAPAADVVHVRCRGTHTRRGPALHFGVQPAHESQRSAQPLLIFPRELNAGWLKICRLAVMDVEWTPTSSPQRMEDASTEDDGASIALGQLMHDVGAANTLFTAWNVLEEARTAYLVAFYGALRLGQSVSLALCCAAQQMRSRRAWQHPHHWAAFQCSALHNTSI